MGDDGVAWGGGKMRFVRNSSKQEYDAAIRHGHKSEMDVFGVLRGGWIYGSHFFYMRGLQRECAEISEEAKGVNFRYFASENIEVDDRLCGYLEEESRNMHTDEDY